MRNIMWNCEKCGREFANRNQAHSCGSYSLDIDDEFRRPRGSRESRTPVIPRGPPDTSDAGAPCLVVARRSSRPVTG